MVNNSRVSRINNAKFSGYCFYTNPSIEGNFQICFSVPFNEQTIFLIICTYLYCNLHSFKLTQFSSVISQKFFIFNQIFFIERSTIKCFLNTLSPVIIKIVRVSLPYKHTTYWIYIRTSLCNINALRMRSTLC